MSNRGLHGLGGRIVVIAMALGLGSGCGDDNAAPGVDAPLDSGSSCHGLALGACRTTAGCIADECPGCSCDVQYRGCLDPGETPAQCPGLGCAQGICCSSELACDGGGATCTPPTAGPGCGACNTTAGSCTVDADCTGASMVCDPIACSCTGVSACVTGCTDDSGCDESESCDVATARCQPRACGAADPCPTAFTCTSGACTRATCTVDRDCDGYCVAGLCYAGRGQCEIATP